MTTPAEKRPINGSTNGSAKKLKSSDVVTINPSLKDIKNDLRDAFVNSKPQKFNNIEIVTEPFKCGVVNNFIKDEEFLKRLKKEIVEEVEFPENNNDLFRFHQSDDFDSVDLPHVKSLRTCFLTEVKEFLKDITQIDLYDDVVDLTASKYEYNDHLLCHDDQLEERRIAFILYLVPGEWSDKDGGAFDMFDRDENGQPKNIARSYYPKWNNFVFFEVTPQSYHQVREVLSQDKIRVSVNGWFRGPKPNFPKMMFIETYTDVVKCGEVEIEENDLRSWLNPLFLKDETQLQVMVEFKDTSEINLSDFLQQEKYHEVCQMLSSDLLEWSIKGPPNRRRYYKLNIDSAPPLARALVQLFQSEAMFLIISNLSGIKYHPLAPDTSDSESESDNSSEEEPQPKPDKPTKVRNPRVTVEIRKWTQGCYTVVHDHDIEVLDDQPKLDCVLHFAHDGETNRDHGGYISYIAKEANGELLAVEPQSNNLSLVYRDSETTRFVKYLNVSHKDVYYDISLIFQQ